MASRDCARRRASEMSAWGLDPNRVSEEAYLKARDRSIQGRIEAEESTRASYPSSPAALTAGR